jgi:putative tricarboxylic transport membrane protein
MKKYDRTSSLVWLGLAIFICVESFRLPLGSIHDPGPGFLPLLVGVLLAGLSVICFLQARGGPSAEPSGPWYSAERWKSLVWILLALLVYALVLDYLGFLLSTFLLLVVLFRFGMEPQRWVWAVGGGVLASVSCYAVFELWLRTQLPKGILGF